MIRQIRDFSETLSSSLQAALADDSPGTKQIDLTVKVTVPPDVVEDIEKELKVIKTS